ncbi:alpha/beta fold hydrolase [Achromobacter marplatensis]|uniref:Alpha/beta fold hydrolase n=1 Tax=Achromobacter marplatensis TaxID=470868 RepID=A0AA43B1I8_9BURK|nr:alpha/beta fold hydrolase [Achromobacter marplatensis]MDH2052010.1 alpha/beta fold hydrolase [Achromobacter marplatensis]
MISYPINAGTTRTRVLESGTSGPVVLFVHGTGGRADRWVRNLDALAQAGYHAFAVDLPGHGFAAKGQGVACSVPAYAAFLHDVLQAIDVQRAVIVGTSLGGHAVSAFACAHPDKVDGIVLVGSMGLVPIGDEARGRIRAGANNQTRDGIATKMQRVIFDSALVTPAMLEEEFRVNNSPGAAESFATLGDYIAQDLDQDVVGAKLNAHDWPVLLIWGEEDKVVPPAIGIAARDLLPRSRLALLARAAHTGYYERPDDFNAILIGFLEGKTGQYQSAGVTWR